MVEVYEMAQFMDNDIAENTLREKNKAPVEGENTIGITASPFRFERPHTDILIRNIETTSFLYNDLADFLLCFVAKPATEKSGEISRVPQHDTLNIIDSEQFVISLKCDSSSSTPLFGMHLDDPLPSQIGDTGTGVDFVSEKRVLPGELQPCNFQVLQKPYTVLFEKLIGVYPHLQPLW